ncbi:hypothetical protein HK405_004136 [Cladochytrium tenue]|nr:hypothetical protein HK405_004136 [Cladochytrium tenue]
MKSSPSDFSDDEDEDGDGEDDDDDDDEDDDDDNDDEDDEELDSANDEAITSIQSDWQSSQSNVDPSPTDFKILFIQMEFCENSTLQDLIREGIDSDESKLLPPKLESDLLSEALRSIVNPENPSYYSRLMSALFKQTADPHKDLAYDFTPDGAANFLSQSANDKHISGRKLLADGLQSVAELTWAWLIGENPFNFSTVREWWLSFRGT